MSPKWFALCLAILWLQGCKLRVSGSAPQSLFGDMPPEGRSTFDQLIAEAPNAQVPYPYSELRNFLKNFGDTVDVLIPLGRSLQNQAGMPNPFYDPRRLLAMSNSKRGLNIFGRVFLGYVQAANQIEVISFNEQLNRFEFQFVSDYGPGLTPKIYYANRSLCTSCHQHGGPIFTPAPWGETNGDLFNASLILRYHPSGTIDGIDVMQGISASPGGAFSYRFEGLVSVAAAQLGSDLGWRAMCPEDRLTCRAKVLREALVVALKEFNSLDDPLQEKIDESIKDAAPPAEILVDRDVMLHAAGQRIERKGATLVNLKANASTRFVTNKLLNQIFLNKAAIKLPDAKKRLSSEHEPARMELEAMLKTFGMAFSMENLEKLGRFTEIPGPFPNPSGEKGSKSNPLPLYEAGELLPELTLAEYELAKRSFENLPKDMDPKTPRAASSRSLTGPVIATLSADFDLQGLARLQKHLAPPKNRSKELIPFVEATFVFDKNRGVPNTGHADLNIGNSNLLLSTGFPEIFGDALIGCRMIQDEIGCNLKTTQKSQTDHPREFIVSLATLYFPRQPGEKSKKESSFTISSGKYVGTYDVRCETGGVSDFDDFDRQLKTEIRVSCRSLDMAILDQVITKLIADKERLVRTALNKDVPQANELLNVVLQEFGEPQVTIPDRGETPNVASLPPAQHDFNGSGSIAVLYEFCGECHGGRSEQLSSKKTTEVPQFLYGANQDEKCRNVEKNRKTIIEALEAGQGENSFMPPVKYPKTLLFNSDVRSGLIKALSAEKLCN